jgi:hypothetical protein
MHEILTLCDIPYQGLRFLITRSLPAQICNLCHVTKAWITNPRKRKKLPDSFISSTFVGFNIRESIQFHSAEREFLNSEKEFFKSIRPLASSQQINASILAGEHQRI